MPAPFLRPHLRQHVAAARASRVPARRTHKEFAMRAHRRIRIASLAVAVGIVLAGIAPSEGAQRTFVSRTGVDSNPCTFSLPCRGFSAAIALTSPGGEVIVLDSAGYGQVTVSQSVSIIAPSGVYAGVSVMAGDGITVNAGANDVVKLRGLRITGLGGVNGIVANSVGLLDVAGVEISGFANRGLDFAAPGGQLVVADSAFTDNAGDGVHVQSSTTTRSFATLVRSRFDGNDNGAVISSNAYGALSEVSASYNATNNLLVSNGGAASIADCTVAGLDTYVSAYGILITDSGSFGNVARCKISGTPYGVIAFQAGAKVTVADTTVVSAVASGLGASFYGEATIERCTVIGGSYSFAAGPNATVHVSNSTAANPSTSAFYANTGGLIESRSNNTVIGAPISSGPGTFTTFGGK